MLSLEDFKGYEKTFYLMRSRENARRLDRTIESLEAGEREEHELIDVS